MNKLKVTICAAGFFILPQLLFAQFDPFTWDTIMSGGIERHYIVDVPDNYDTCTLYPMMFNLHGLGSNAPQQRLYSQMKNVADTAGFIVVSPTAINDEWNIDGSGVDDVGFISNLIDTMNENYSIDLNRVYSTGMSMGGFMSYRLACELTNRIAAIASVTGLLNTFPCNPSRTIPVMQIHGTEDPTVPFSYVDTVVSFWLQHNNCPLTPVVTNIPDINQNDSCTAVRYYYGLCDDSTEVINYTIQGGGHTWPGAFLDIGITNQDFSASSVIWNFFKKYKLNVSNPQNPCVNVSVDELQNCLIRVYPNPAQTVVYLDCAENTKELTVEINDLLGKKVASIGRYQSMEPISLTHLETGIYYIVVYDSGELIGNTKLAVR